MRRALPAARRSRSAALRDRAVEPGRVGRPRAVHRAAAGPDLLELVAMVRASGRLLWVGYYALMLAVPAIIVRNFSAPAATAVLAFGLALQIADLSPRYLALNGYFRQHFIVEAAPARRSAAIALLGRGGATLQDDTLRAVIAGAAGFQRRSPCSPPTTACASTSARSHASRSARRHGATAREQALAAGPLDQCCMCCGRHSAAFRAGRDDAPAPSTAFWSWRRVGSLSTIVAAARCRRSRAARLPNSRRHRRDGAQDFSGSSFSSWILRVSVFRPQPSHCAASIRCPPV